VAVWQFTESVSEIVFKISKDLTKLLPKFGGFLFETQCTSTLLLLVSAAAAASLTFNWPAYFSSINQQQATFRKAEPLELLQCTSQISSGHSVNGVKPLNE